MEQQLSDIERRGLEAATALVERFASVATRRDLGAVVEGDRRATDDLGRAFAEAVQTTAAAWNATEARPTGRDLDLSAAGAAVVALETGVGETATSTLWVHNPTSSDVEGLRFVAGSLSSAATITIPSSAVQIDPAVIDRVPAGSSREVSISVRPPATAGAARYRGVVQVAGHDDLWALLDLTVV